MARAPLTDRSTGVTSGSTTVLTADQGRCYLLVNNPDVALPIYLNLTSGGTAVAHASGSIALLPGATIQFDNFVHTGPIQATTSGGTCGITIYTNP